MLFRSTALYSYGVIGKSEAHTSGATFDATKWTADPKAVGAPWDLSQLGSVVTAQARKTANGTVILTLDTTASDLAGGVVSMAIAPSDWALIGGQFGLAITLGFDAQIADSDGSRVTTVRYNGTVHDFAMLNPLADTPAARGAIQQAITALRNAVRV